MEQKGRNIYLDEKAIYYITDKREIQINSYGLDYTLDNFIYDLIQANLVEKVSD